MHLKNHLTGLLNKEHLTNCFVSWPCWSAAQNGVDHGPSDGPQPWILPPHHVWWEISTTQEGVRSMWAAARIFLLNTDKRWTSCEPKSQSANCATSPQKRN